jgi:UDP-N-acetylmuramoyl-tripeptide--D-alanyl-D-alanine ligase
MSDAAATLWTPEALQAATQGRVVGAPGSCGGINFDSRAVESGDLFVALQGERDGHDFVAAAFERGAACALVSRELDGAGPQIVVGDTLKGLEALAAFARDRAGARRAAVTGSVGKTSTTQAILAGLTRAGRAHGAVKSFNNHIGVPLTLARMPRDAQRAVFEIGMNHAGEIGPLSRLVQPDVALINNVGPVHTENFADGERGVAFAKAEIFEGLKPGGTAVLNADNAWFDLLRAEAQRAGARVVSFGEAEGADARLLDWRLDGSARLRASLHGREIDYALLQTGRHWGPNSLAVLLVLEALDVPLETGLAALAEFAPLAGRGAEKTVGGVQLVDESYNANPLSMRAAMISLGGRAGDPARSPDRGAHRHAGAGSGGGAIPPRTGPVHRRRRRRSRLSCGSPHEGAVGLTSGR